MKSYKRLFAVLFLAMPLLFSCSKKDDDIKPSVVPVINVGLKINTFIQTTMTDVYLWSDKVDTNIELNEKTNPIDYFNQLVYREKDKWSWITDDVVALQNSFAGKEKSFGYSLKFAQILGGDRIVAIVEYVYPNTPAAKAGLKRGSIISGVNDKLLNKNNAYDLLFKENIKISLIKYTDNGMVADGTKRLVAEELDLDPVLISKVIKQGDKKIGYLFYAQYISTKKYLASMDKALQTFKDAGVTDIVLDLRYNRGGAVNAAKHLCSALAPEKVVNKEDVLITYQWNEKYQNYFKGAKDLANLEERFDKKVPVKLNLNNLYVLTGKNTASASELTITGLKPYMDKIVTIGDRTHGKYCASITVVPKMYYSEKPKYYEDFKNWAIQPIVTKYANATGVTDFENGFEPTYAVKDELLPAIALGNVEEPLLKKAIEIITNKPVVTKVKTSKIAPLDYKVIGGGFSRFDRQKEVLNIGTIEIPVE